MSRENRLLKISRQTLSEILADAWKEDQSSAYVGEDETKLALRRLLREQHPLIVEEVFHCLKEHQPAAGEGDFLILEGTNGPSEIEEPTAIPPRAYLRAILTTIWETFRHPLCTSTIDLATGRVIDRF